MFLLLFSHGTIVLMKNTSKLGKRHTPLVIGNWKMNPTTVDKAENLFAAIKKLVNKKNSKAEVTVAVPYVYISAIQKLSKGTKITVGAQDVFYEQTGAYTGEISLSMLKSFGIKNVIVGHSMRRALGETYKEVHLKTKAVLKSGLTAVVCVGEKKRDAHGDYFGAVEAQLKSVLVDIPNAHMARLVIAYEPVWAIGTGKNATSDDVQEMKLFIQKTIADFCGRNMVPKVRILYGGSVNASNAKSLLEIGEVDGFLVGGASLKATEFAHIVRVSDTYAST